jgi:hypothetical protein
MKFTVNEIKEKTKNGQKVLRDIYYEDNTEGATMSDKINLGINPFDGDFGDGEIQFKKEVTGIPMCHECNKPLIEGKCVTKVDYKPDWDFEKMNEIEVFYWHEKCWLKIQKELGC